ncbi:hypothetical protein KAJ61_02445 [Candidatus Parcubacteria bacterium]|nr:hypothetical protein [Candidatus Parcubacteria bacterium]
MSNEQTILPENNAPSSPVEQKTNYVSPEEKLSMSSIQDLLKQSWPIYKSNLKKLIGMILLPMLAFIALGILFLLLGVSGWFLFKDVGETGALIIKILFSLIILAGMFFGIAIAVIAQAGLYILIKDSKENITIKEAFLRAKKIAGKFFVLNLLIGIFVMLWSLLFIIPGMYMALAYSMAIWIFIYEGISGTAAIKKSKELIKGHWWAVLGRFAGVYLIFYLIIVMPTIFLGDNGLGVLWMFITQILSFLAAPFFIIYQCFIYWDLKRVKGE